MKKLVVAFLLLSSVGWAQTQAEMSRQAYEDYHQVDQELNDVYQQILNLYRSDTAFIQHLKSSQRIWIQFRDAELGVKYPEKSSEIYGSIHPICRAGYLSELTQEGIDRLKKWIEGSWEGDVCAGSVRIK